MGKPNAKVHPLFLGTNSSTRWIEPLSSYSLKLTREQSSLLSIQNSNSNHNKLQSNLTIHQITPPCCELHNNGCSFIQWLPHFQSIQGNLHRTTYSFLSFPLSPYNTLSLTLFVWTYMGSGLVSSNWTLQDTTKN